MPLNKGKSLFSDQLSKLNASHAFFTVSPMNFMMAICTKCFKIFNFVIKSISINVMHNQKLNIINSTTIANNFAMIFNRSRKTIWHIRNFRFQSSVDKCRTGSTAKFLLSTLKCDTSSNYFSAKLTGMALNASKRTIFFIFGKKNSFKFFSTSFTNSFIYFTIRIFTLFGTVNFSFLTSWILSFKFLITNFTFIHKYHLKKESYYATCKR